METRKIQRSGSTHYVYLPSSWCREQNISTDSVVFLNKNVAGDLIIKTKRPEEHQTALNLELNDTNPEVINKFIVASYINPIKKFDIKTGKPLGSEQILEHKSLLGGFELLDFEDDKIFCQTTLSLGEPDVLLDTMIRKLISVTNFIKKGSTFDLIERYEREIDKINLLVHKSIISGLMYRADSKLKHVELFYIGSLSRNLEQMMDTLINIKKDDKILDDVMTVLKKLEICIQNINQPSVESFIRAVSKLESVEVKDSKTFYKNRIMSILSGIGEILADWVVTRKIDEQ